MPPQQRQLHDEYFKRAKAEGYVARSAYKLIEITEKKWLIKRGDAVLDLGCAPGSWLQVAEKMVGPEGVVVGVDLTEVRHRFGDNVHVVQGDIYQMPPEALIGGMGMPFDAVLSDMAPNTSGHGDDFLSVRLCRRMIELLPGVLKRGGHMVMKVLEGSEFPELLREVKLLFREAGGYKPAASRDVSREMFIWGKGYKGQAPGTRHLTLGKTEEKAVVPLVVPLGRASGWEVEKEEEASGMRHEASGTKATDGVMLEPKKKLMAKKAKAKSVKKISKKAVKKPARRPITKTSKKAAKKQSKKAVTKPVKKPTKPTKLTKAKRRA